MSFNPSWRRVHFIAIGGAVMHNLAIDMFQMGYRVTGSDDEIYEPSKSRLASNGLLPIFIGWDDNRISPEIEFIILGMHARKENIELVKAQNLSIPIYSYPELVYHLSTNKKRVVIAGSHGKTTITSMIIHVLRKLNFNFDYLVGAHVEGFTNMVKISDAPILVVEGDEYLSSPIDPKPKIHHYHPHITVLSGIAWDHINVFPRFEDYLLAFETFIGQLEPSASLVYNESDEEVCRLVQKFPRLTAKLPYTTLERAGLESAVTWRDKIYPVSVMGNHNLANMAAAMMVCNVLGVSSHQFLERMGDFKGAAKRLQCISSKGGRHIYLDFAHAPSKVKTTTTAFKNWFGDKKLLAVLELHTFSSLDKNFLPQYKNAMDAADEIIIFYSRHTLTMKNKPILDPVLVKDIFDHPSARIITEVESLKLIFGEKEYRDCNILFMTSGNFDQLDLQAI